jgi:thiol-disulfide isomerase/thioredoxin
VQVSLDRLHVVMINGGGTKEGNFQSHLLHVQHLTELLLAAGVARDRITIFSSDGSDPSADLAVRERQAEKGFWRLGGTRVESFLRNPVTFVDSVVAGMALRPATRAVIGEWFDGPGKRLQAGDVLFLYVTDHGTINADDLDDNHITLWGKTERLSVRQLREMLEKLHPDVRVVTVMSQCFSGSFANLMDAHAGGAAPTGNVCGYFASTADRPAYGCYPENRGRLNVGHSFHFLQALGSDPNFRTAHEQVLVSDGTPDVPLRTSDEYLDRLLRNAAGNVPEATAALVDDLLGQAWKDKAAWEHEIRLLDRIGKEYGTFSPRSLAEIDAQSKQLPDISEQMKNTSRAWQGALGDSNDGNLGRFLASNDQWRAKLKPELLEDLPGETRREMTRSLIADLEAFTRADATTEQKLRTLRRNRRNAAAASYRMEVRLGVILRMRKILVSVAGRQYLRTRASAEERAAYERLRECEELVLPSSQLPAPQLAAGKPFPPFEQDVKRAQAALPAWIGIQFREPRREMAREHDLSAGAAVLITVFPDSPAGRAGLEQGDIVLGPPGAHFTERGQVRSWTMLSKVGEPRQLEVLRGKEQLTLTLIPAPYPLKWPELPGPPKIGSLAPALPVTPYRGEVPTRLADGKPHLLFFWATWCIPCKSSLPELLAFERERGVPVIAITDEPADRLTAFFNVIDFEFPKAVAVDEYRKSFVNYGVSGTPTFILVDADGTVRSVGTGYDPAKGLPIEGWKWKK